MITGIIMASGFSKRMKKNKLLLDVNGETMIEKILKTICHAELKELILIYKDHEIKQIAEKYNIRSIFNPKAHLGQSEAVKLGVKIADSKNKGYMFITADQPFLTKTVLDTLIFAFKNNQNKIIVPVYKNKQGSPTIFPSVYKNQLLALTGDRGGKQIIIANENNVLYQSIDDERAGQDVDIWDDYINIIKR